MQQKEERDTKRESERGNEKEKEKVENDEFRTERHWQKLQKILRT